MSELVRFANERADAMVCAGLGLEAIADLLGGGSDHSLTADQTNGLHHAIIALGRMVKDAGYDMSSLAAQHGAEQGKGVLA